MLKLSHPHHPPYKRFTDLVRDLSLTIHEGEKVAIIGEEGNGKSSLLQVLMSPKILTKLSDHRRRNHHFLSLLCLYSPIFAGSLEGKTLEEYFLEKTSWTMPPSTDWLINCSLIATALQAIKLSGSLSEEKPSKSNCFTNFVVLMNCYFRWTFKWSGFGDLGLAPTDDPNESPSHNIYFPSWGFFWLRRRIPSFTSDRSNTAKKLKPS